MFRVDLENRVIDARGVVEERYEGQSGFSSDDFVEAFADLDGEDITIILNSAGGVVSEGLSIFNQIEARSGETTIVVDAVAASIASVIAMAADRIVMRRKAQLFIHDPWTVAMGNAAGFRTVADHLDALAREIADVYATRSASNGVTTDVDIWLRLMRDETWFNADQAIDAGLADEISRPQVRTAIDEEQQDEETQSPYSISARMTEPDPEQEPVEPVAVLHSAKVLAAALDKRHRIMRQRLGIS